VAVADRTWKPYAGPLTRPRWRFLVLPRHAWQEVFASRMFGLFFALCFFVPVICAGLIYIRHNVSALAALNVVPTSLPEINARMFLAALTLQAQFGFLLAFLVGPAIVSSDLRNNALPLYLSRPLSRGEYVLGKFCVLAILLSAISWAPFLLLFALQSALADPGWIAANARIAPAILASSLAWLVFLSLLTLALSAWMRRAATARLMMVFVYIVLAGLGNAANKVLDTRWGDLLDIVKVYKTIWAGAFGLGDVADLPVAAAWAMLGGFSGLSLLLLWRKVRAAEVVR